MTHNPEPKYCMRCKKTNQNCDQLKFEKMPVYREYPGVAIIVHCVEYDEKD